MRKLPRIVQALLPALQFRNADASGLGRLNDADWHALLQFCDRAHLTFPLWQTSKKALPDWVIERIERNAHDNMERFERIKGVYQEIAEAFTLAQVEHVVIKGFAQYPGYVESPCLRMQSDIDIYCPSDSIDAAYARLQSLRYRPAFQIDTRTDHLPALTRKTSWQWQGNAFDPEMPPSIELHHCLWNHSNLQFMPKGVDQFWIRRTDRQVGGISFPALNLVDNFGFSALHILREVIQVDSILSRAYELARFLHFNVDNREFWQEWEELHDPSLRSMESISFWLAQEYFSCEMPGPAEKSVYAMPANARLWLERFGDSPVEKMFSALPNKDGVWLNVALAESSSAKRTVLRAALLPKKAPVMGAPWQGLTKDGKKKRFWPTQRHLKYALYFLERLIYHVRVLPPTLWHGLQWWLSTKKLRSKFWMFFATSFFFTLGMSVYFFLFNFYLLELGFKEKFIGLVTGAMTMGGIAGTIPAGMLAKRFGLQATLLLCFSLVSSASALRALATTEALQLGLTFVAGFALSMWAVCLSPALAALTEEENRPFAFSLIFSSGIGIGALGGICGGVLPALLSRISAQRISAHASRYGLLVACAITALGLWPASRLEFPPISRARSKFPLRNPFLLRFLPVIAVWSFVTGAFGPFFNVFFSRHVGMSVQKIGFVFSISQLSQVIAILLAPQIFKAFGLVAGIMYTQIATAVALVALAGVGGSSSALAYVIYTSFQWMGEPGMYSLLMNKIDPAERNDASALNFLVISLAQSVAAIAAGSSFMRYGYPTVLIATACMALLTALITKILLGEFKAG